MKSTINETFKSKEKPFPKLMISTDEQEVVLFTDEEGSGAAVAVGERSLHEVGFFQEWDMKYFKDFHGSITITSED